MTVTPDVRRYINEQLTTLLSTVVADTRERVSNVAIPRLRSATVVGTDPDTGDTQVLVDGDDDPISVQSLVAGVAENDRVTITFQPPSGCFILGVHGGQGGSSGSSKDALQDAAISSLEQEIDAIGTGIELSALPTATTPAGSERLLTEQGGTAKQVSVDGLFGGLLGNTTGWSVATGELWLPNTVVAGGVATGGSIRHAHHLHLLQDYTQTVPPTDPALGTPLLIEWNGTFSDDAGGLLAGPQLQTELFGPRGTINVEGVLHIDSDQGVFRFGPITMADMLIVRNVAGHDRTIGPGWGYIFSRITVADDAAVTLNRNDLAKGTSGFVDSQVFATENSGTMNGADYEITSFLSAPIAAGNGTFLARVAYDINPINEYLDVPKDWGAGLADLGLLPNSDAGNADVAFEVGLRVPHFTAGVFGNIGIQNGSTTINVPQTQAVTSAGTTIRCDATIVYLDPDASRTLTSTPTIAAGISDGQVLTLINIDSTFTVTLQKDGVLAGSGLDLLANTIEVGPFDTVQFMWNVAEGKWVKTGGTQHRAPILGSVLGTPYLIMEPNPANSGEVMGLRKTATNRIGLYQAQWAGEQTWDFGADGHVTLTAVNDGSATRPQVQLWRSGQTSAFIGIGTFFGVPTLGMGNGTTSNYHTLTRTSDSRWTLNGADLDARIVPQYRTVTSSATPAPTSADDVYAITALATAATIANPTGTPLPGHRMTIRIKDNGTSRALAWGSQYRGTLDLPLPVRTTVGETLYLDFVWNVQDTKWDLVRANDTTPAPSSSENWQRYRQALATGSVSTVMFGDSIVEGYGATTIPDRWVNKVANAMAAAAGVAAPTDGYMAAEYGDGPGQARVTGTPRVLTGTVSLGTNGLGRRSYRTVAGVSNHRDWTVTGTKVRVLYNKTNATYDGAFTVTIDGTPSTVIDAHQAAAGPTPAVWESGTLTAGTHTVVVTTVNTGAGAKYAVEIAGVMTVDGPIELWEAGHSAFSSWVPDAVELGHVAIADPDIVFLAWGVNDPFWNTSFPGGFDPADLAQRANDTADAIATKLGHPVTFVYVAAWGNAGSPGQFTPYRDALKAAALARGFGFVDMLEGLGEQTGFPTVLSVDGLHPNDDGQNAWASMIKQALPE